jgi:hypothetical protein
MISAWLDTTALIEDSYKSPSRRKPAKRVVVNEAKAREILQSLYRTPAKHDDPPFPPPKSPDDRVCAGAPVAPVPYRDWRNSAIAQSERNQWGNSPPLKPPKMP